MQRVKKNDQSSEKNGSTRYRRVFEMFREINVAGFVLKNEVIELWFLVSASRTRDFGGLGDGLLPYSQTLPLTLSVVPYPLLMAY